MIEILRSRRSIRKYLDKPVESEKVALLKEAVLRSPSSKNINPWEFIFVDDPAIIRKMKQCKPHGAAPLETAPLAVVICADVNKNDVWIEDCSIASIILQLMAHSLQLGSCWIQIRNRKYDLTITSEIYLQELLGIPLQYKILDIITIGYSQKERLGKPDNELQYDKIHTNRF